MSEIRQNELRQIFFDLVSSYASTEKSQELWDELSLNYNSPDRAYHNFNHINHFYDQLMLVRNEISGWKTVLFSLFYHDIIYDIRLHDNEEKSADLAAERLSEIGIAKEVIENWKSQILATKNCTVSDDHDINLFTDADLSILGSDPDSYITYSKSIRAEYLIYPDDVYNPARMKVLKHFLDMDSIYKTVFFREKYESRARRNIQSEIES